MQLGHGSNIEAMRHRVDLTMHLYPWVQMVMFSELAVHGPRFHLAQMVPAPAEEELQPIARHHRIWLINGSMYERHDGAIHNTTSIINPDGEVIGRLVFSRNRLGPDEMGVIGHTGCGLLDADGAALRARLIRETGEDYEMDFGSFHDLALSIRASLARLRAHAWLRPGPVHGLIFDVATGRLHEVPER